MTILEEIELFDLKEPSNIKYSRIRYPIGIQHLIEQYSLICNIDAEAKKAGLSYGQYVAKQYAEKERQLRLMRQTMRDAIRK